MSPQPDFYGLSLLHYITAMTKRGAGECGVAQRHFVPPGARAFPQHLEPAVEKTTISCGMRLDKAKTLG
jgi:hypothetical protein